jgi:hypothetical protein
MRPFSLLRPFSLPDIAPLALVLAVAAGLAGCGDKGYSPDPEPVEEGLFITDTNYTLDEFPFDSSDCAEVFPAGSISSDTRDPDAVASLRLISTACYHARVRVLNSDKDTVRAFDSRFAIFNRTEGEKNRGVVGYLSWDGRDDEGKAVPEGRYVWRMEFDFGDGRIRKFRTDFLVR